MATRGRVQLRHATKSDFDTYKSNILPEEVVIVDSGHPETTNGKALYYRTASGEPVRVANADEVTANAQKYDNCQLSGSSPYQNADDAIENDTIYHLYFNSSSTPVGWLIFCGKKQSGSVAQIQGNSAGELNFRKGTASSGTVTWGDWAKFVPASRTVAGIDLADNITAEELKQALDIKSVIVIDSTTSSGWGEDIPDTFEGEAGDIAYYDEYGTLWYLYNVDGDEYTWLKLATVNDLSEKEDKSNKVSAITDENKGSTTLYPSVKAVVDYSYPVIETAVEPDEYAGSALVGKVGQLAHYSGNGKLYVCTSVDFTSGGGVVYNWSLFALPDSATIEGSLSDVDDSGNYSNTNLYIRGTTTLHAINALWKQFRVVKVNCSYMRYGTLYDTGAVCYITGVTGSNQEKISGVLILNAGNSGSKYQRVHVMEQIGDSSSDTLDLSTKYTLPSYDCESTGNKVTSLSAQSTDAQYPSAKCVYDMIGDVETLLSQV